jgi:hypothetical protein
MPAYNPYSHHQPPGAPQFNQSQGNFYDDSSLYNYPTTQGYDDHESMKQVGMGGYTQNSPYGIERPGTANGYGAHYQQTSGYSIERPATSNSMSPYGIERPGTASIPDPRARRYEETYDPHDVYQGRTLTSPDGSQRRSPHPISPSSGLAYDSTAHYTGTQQGYDPSMSSPHSAAYSGYSSNSLLHGQRQ